MTESESYARKALLDHINGKGGSPKRFRIWDEKHHRWFQGGITNRERELGVDCISFFGEIMIMEGTLFDQHEDDVWKNDPDIHGSLSLLDWLIVVQDTGNEDMNGTRIFEGDILITDDNLIGYVSYDPNLGYVLNSPYHGVVLTTFDTCIYKGNVFQHYDMWFKDLDDEDKWTACCRGE